MATALTTEGTERSGLEVVRVGEAPGGMGLLAPLVLQFAYHMRARGRRVEVEKLLRWAASTECVAFLVRRPYHEDTKEAQRHEGEALPPSAEGTAARSVGFVICTVEEGGEPEPTLWIQAVYHSGRGQGSGFRGMVIEALEAEMRRRGLRRLGGETADPRLWRLAQRLGFRVTSVCLARG